MVSINSYQDIPMNNETALLQGLQKQSISVSIEASGRDFQLYAGVSPPQNPSFPPPPQTLVPCLFPCYNKFEFPEVSGANQ